MNLLRPNIDREHLLKGDTTVWIILFMLCMISIIEVYSASSRDTYTDGRYWAPMIQHGVFLLGGILLAWVVSKIPCKLFKILCTAGLGVSILMLVYLLCGGGVTLNGGSRWIPFFGITIQPSEIAKISIVGFGAFALATWRDKEKQEASPHALKLVSYSTMAVCLLIFKENFSTAGLIFIVMLVMCYFANAPKKFLLTLCAIIIVGGSIAFSLMKFTPTPTITKVGEVTHLQRLVTWHNRLNEDNTLPVDPSKYNIKKNEQVTHAQIAVATCGIVGKGPGKSVERDFLPMAFSDFIYAIIIEEGGMEMGLLVMSMYLLLVYRAMRIADRCKNRFPAYLAMGLSLMLVVQAMINMAVAVGAMPVTGQPLPLVSKGGTSTFITCAYIGMILSVSHTAKQKEEEVLAEVK